MVRGIKQVLEDIKHWVQIMLMLFSPENNKIFNLLPIKVFSNFYYDKISNIQFYI